MKNVPNLKIHLILLGLVAFWFIFSILSWSSTLKKSQSNDTTTKNIPALKIKDYRGQSFPTYKQIPKRIASLSSRADQILWLLGLEQHLVVVTDASLRVSISDDTRIAFSNAKIATRSDQWDLVVRSTPELLFVDPMTSAHTLQIFEEEQVPIFMLSPANGAESFATEILKLSKLFHRSTQGELLAKGFLSKLNAFTSKTQRKSAIYLSIVDRHIFGAGPGSTIFDVMYYAHYDPVFLEHLGPWPAYSQLNLLDLLKRDPDFLVTEVGMKDSICEHETLSRLRACHEHGVSIELDAYLLGDPGLGMLTAVRALGPGRE